MARYAVTVIVEGDYPDAVRACRDVDAALTTHRPLRRGLVWDLLPASRFLDASPPPPPTAG